MSREEGAAGLVGLVTGTGGPLGLCGPLPQGTECRVCSPPLPQHLPCFGVPGSDLGWSRAMVHVQQPSQEGLGASSPAPSALAELSLCSPLPRLAPLPRGSCLLPATHGGHFPSLPVGGFDSFLALCADMCWWQLPKRG